MSEQEGGSSGGDSVPAGVQARLDRVTEQRRAAESRVADLERQLADVSAKATKADAFAKELDAYRAKEAAWGDEKAIMAGGITDPEGVDFARVAWQRLAPEQRPAGGLKEWLSKPEALPKAVRAYLAEQGVQSGSQQSTQTAQPAGLPPSNRGSVPTTPGGQPALTVDQIMNMSAEEYAKQRTDLLAGKR